MTHPIKQWFFVIFFLLAAHGVMAETGDTESGKTVTINEKVKGLDLM